MEKFIPCRACKNKKGPRNKPGFYYKEVPYGKTTTRLLVECDCHKEWKQKSKFRILAKENSIWYDSAFEDIAAGYRGTKSIENLNRIIKYTTNFEDFKDAMVYLYGPNGTQKTTIAQWVGAYLLYRGYSVKYMLMNELVKMASDLVSVEDDKERQATLDRLASIDLLIIDESFAADKVQIFRSGHQLPAFDQFIRSRVEFNKKGVMFISNTAPEEIANNKFSKSIQDLVLRNTRPFTTALEFSDNYREETAKFKPKDLFA